VRFNNVKLVKKGTCLRISARDGDSLSAMTEVTVELQLSQAYRC